MRNSGKKGFTLIELLVVIAIIGVLASIVLASLDSSRKKGRDARRLSGIKQIQLALEVYYDQNNAFPPNNTSTTFDPTLLTTPGYIPVVPVDPSTGVAYRYTAYNSGAASGVPCVSYHLGATLESANHSALSQDSDINSTRAPLLGNYSICTGGPANDFDGLALGANCGGANGTAVPAGGGSGTELCYDVRP